MQGLRPHLIEDILGRPSEQDGAGLGILAVHQETVELVPNLEHLEKPCSCSNVCVPDLLHSA